MVKLQVQQSQLAAVLVLQQRFEYSAHVMFRQLTAQLKCAERKSIYIKSSTFNRNLCLTCLNELRSICHNTAGIRYLTVLLNQTFVFGVDWGCSLMLHLSRFNTEQTPKICLQSSRSDSTEWTIGCLLPHYLSIHWKRKTQSKGKWSTAFRGGSTSVRHRVHSITSLISVW